jgi:outer membrane protein insertion porin family
MDRWIVSRAAAGLAAWMFFVFVHVAGAVQIKSISVQNTGAGDLDEASVLSYMSTKPGDEFDRSGISRDVKTLEKSGRFSYVGIEIEQTVGGIDVFVLVERKLRLRRLEVEGVKAIRDKKVRDLLGIRVGDFLDEPALSVAARQLEKEYESRYHYRSKVTWKKEVDERNASAMVTFIVEEGIRAKLKNIEIAGNVALSDRILKKSMRQQEWWFLSFLSKSGRFKPSEIQQDVESIRSLYMNEGYLDVEVGEPEIDVVDNSHINITIPITEGRVYLIRNVSVAGNSTFDESEFMPSLSIQPGTIASSGEMERSRRMIRDYYGSRGYIRTRVQPDVQPDLAQGTVDIEFNVREGKLAYIRNINIRGNSRTKDKVIRRELVVYPGDIYNEVKVKTSERRLQNLNFFETVRSSPGATSESDQFDVDIDVKEKRTGQFVVGFGFSSIDDLIGFIEISQANFNLLGWPNFTGGGQKMRIRAQLGTERRDLELSFIEPWFLDRKLSFQVDLFQSDQRFLSDDYEQRNTGGRIGFGKAISRHDRLNLRYGLQEIDVSDVEEDASDEIKAEEGSQLKSSATLQLVHDTRDSYFVSSRGNRTSASVELAGGALGGDTDLYKLELKVTQYIPLWFDHVLNLRAWGATVEEYGDSERVPIFDRLFLGGARTLRGFDFRDVGPKDENGEPVGGKSGAYATAEYLIPVAPTLRLAAFYDMGVINEDAFDPDFGNYNSDYGFGIRLDIPGFPLRLDYAWPVEADEFNDRSSGRFNFLIGYVL